MKSGTGAADTPAHSAGRPAGLWLHGASGRMGAEITKAVTSTPNPGFRLVGGSAKQFAFDVLLQGKTVTVETLAHALSRQDVQIIIDFSTIEGNATLFAACQAADVSGRALLLGTTGLTAECLDQWRTLALAKHMRLLIAPNTSIGILVLLRAAIAAAGSLVPLDFDVEIIETHHRHKVDAPSGTAKFLATTLAASLSPDEPMPTKIQAQDGMTIVTTRPGRRQEHEIGVHSVRGGGVVGEHQIRLLGEHEEICLSHRAYSRSLFAAGALTLAKWLYAQPSGCYGLTDVSFS